MIGLGLALAQGAVAAAVRFASPPGLAFLRNTGGGFILNSSGGHVLAEVL